MRFLSGRTEFLDLIYVTFGLQRVKTLLWWASFQFMGQGNSACWLAYGPDFRWMVIGLQAGEFSLFLLRKDQTSSGTHPVCLLLTHLEHAVAQLRQCATRRRVAGSIPDEIIGIYHWHTRNPSGHTMALGSTQPLTEMRPVVSSGG